MQPTHIYHADWGTAPKKRWLARAKLDSDGRYTADCPNYIENHTDLIPSIRRQIKDKGCAVVGFDFPIGIPVPYARMTEVTEFKSFLRGLGNGKWADFYNVARVRSEISVHRPLYPFAPGGKNQSHLLNALGLKTTDDLRRECEKQQAGRRAACPLFWTLGASQVGKGAIVGWRDVLAPALRHGGAVLIWPFDGHLNELLRRSTIVIAETYPAECYTWFLAKPLKGKGKQEIRRSAGAAMMQWAQVIGVRLHEELSRAIDDGFPQGDDAFDAVVGLLGIIAVVTGQRQSGEPTENKIRMLEGWILGQST